MKLKRYQIVTALLFIYALFMTLYFGLDILKAGQYLRFFGTIVAEAAVITLTFFALRKRDRIRENRRGIKRN